MKLIIKESTFVMISDISVLLEVKTVLSKDYFLCIPYSTGYSIEL